MESVRGLGESYRSGKQSPVSVTEDALGLADRLNPVLDCFITVLRESALSDAERSEKRFEEGRPLGPLDGVPVAVKDIFYIEGVRCTAGSKILANNVAPYDSTAVARLKSAGAVIMGTTNLHEFASGVTNVNPHFGPVRNPWDTSRIAGGSSGGSAAAVAAGIACAALGTDTAGSVRIPAALCGVVGLKPTYGRVSRLGVVPLASSFDTVGTLTRTAWDAAAMLQALAGHAADDLTTAATEVPDYLKLIEEPADNPKVGVPRSYFHDTIDPLVEEVFLRFVDRLKADGCTIVEAEFDGAADAYASWLPVRRAEATAFHLRWLEQSPELYGEDVRKRLEMGRQVTAVEYVNAQNMRPALMNRFAVSTKGCDAVLVPTTSIVAPPIGAGSVAIGTKEVEVYEALTRSTIPFNLVGFPAVTIPAGQAAGLPVGIQLVARPFEEASILGLANWLETKHGAHAAPPPLR